MIFRDICTVPVEVLEVLTEDIFGTLRLVPYSVLCRVVPLVTVIIPVLALNDNGAVAVTVTVIVIIQ